MTSAEAVREPARATVTNGSGAPMLIGMIWAQTPDGVIGKDNDMPWHLPEDLAHFKRVTMGHPVIMGRKSWDALPERWRPLPGRSNIVLTRDRSWRAEGAIAVHSLQDALEAASQAVRGTDPQDTGTAADAAKVAAAATSASGNEVWIIGGEKVFVDAVALANVAIVTEIDLHVEAGDAFAPKLGSEWVRDSVEPAQGWSQSKADLRYRISRYSKR